MGKKITWLCLVLAFFCFRAEGQLVINEVLAYPNQDWNGDGVLGLMGDEWIEIKNRSWDTISLTGYYLRDDFGSDPHLGLSGALGPGQVMVFYGSQALAWQREQGQAEYGFALDNWGERVQLLRQVGSELILVDEVALQNHETDYDRSSGYSAEDEVWTLFDAWNIYLGHDLPMSTSCQPTPGQENQCLPLVGNETLTWSAVKSRYR